MRNLRICFILATLMIGVSSQSPNVQRGTMRVRKKPTEVIMTTEEGTAKLKQEKIRKQAEEDSKAQKDSLAKAAKDKLKIKKPW